MSPCASAESAGQIGFEQDGNAARQANLPTMRMSAQHQVETGVGGLPINFRSVRKQDRDTTMWNIRRRFLDVVCAIEMCVVDPGEVDRSPAAVYRDAFVEQHTNAECLEVGNHDNRVVVAEHRIDVAAKRFT